MTEEAPEATDRPIGRQPGRMVDPRLVRYAEATKSFLHLSVLAGTATAGLVIAQAWFLASIIAGAFVQHLPLLAMRDRLVALCVVVVARALLGWATEVMANRAAAAAKSELRRALVDRVATLGPAGLDTDKPGSVAVLATTGIDALDGYFARYLPQLVLAVIVPLAIVAAVIGVDWVSALIIALTVPLIPLFMALVGVSTSSRTQRRAEVLDRLAGHFLDVVEGLPTLKVFRRARAQAATIATFTDRYRRTTMETLRLAFLSSLILELLATVSVALVAVAMGLRLLAGDAALQTAFFVLILAPEAYWPLRRLGASYHASADGLVAARSVLDLLDRPARVCGTRTDVPNPSSSPLVVDRLEVIYPSRRLPALRELSMRVDPGEHVAIAGASGAGKSTLLGVLLGLVEPTQGTVAIGGVDLSTLDPVAWRSRLAWVPQRPHLFRGTLQDNVRLGAPGASDDAVSEAISAAGLDPVIARLDGGVHATLDTDGIGLSVGERQRVALARAFVRDAPLLLLDEPTANLDGETEREVLDALLQLVEGRTVLLVAHRPTLLALADRVVELSPSLVAP